MCGFAGFIDPAADRFGLEAIVRSMADQLVRRGPDDAGAWCDADSGFALGHRRLAVLDLSPAGHQPMLSASGRWVLAYNGEIYNHLELRAELDVEGMVPEWRGHSDTETLLALVEAWGLERTLPRLVGMFAFALWDRESRSLHLARDRFGEKPLYYGWAGKSFVFASELKALRPFPGFSAEVDREALGLFLRFTYVPAPFSIWKGIFKLEPGCRLTLSGGPTGTAPAEPLRAGQNHHSVRVSRWWSLAESVERGSTTPFSDEREAVDEIETALKRSVSRQTISDVPLGAFLSGGVDSSAITALMQVDTDRPVKTFTIGFDEAGFDESRHAAAVARHLGTDHTEARVSSAEARGVIPDLPEIHDEPFADSSQIPTHLVCRAAREHVTVALSGDGGDELFGGYNRYRAVPKIWARVGSLPDSLRRAAGRLADLVPSSLLASGMRTIGRAGDAAQLSNRLGRVARSLQCAQDVDEFYFGIVSEWPEGLVKKGSVAEAAAAIPLFDPTPEHGMNEPAQRMIYRDSISYLPDDILCKVDRAAMAVSLETRVPFLDPAVVELAWRLPLNMKIRDGSGKWALRQFLYKHVPRELIERPKAGFAVPIGVWLRGPLREWAEALLDPERIDREGYLESAPIRTVWKEHLSGRRDWTPRLWTVLMFQAWLEKERQG